VGGGADTMNLTNEDVQEILRLLDASSFDELHLATDRFKLTLRRAGVGGWTQEGETASAAPSLARGANLASGDAAAGRGGTGAMPAAKEAPSSRAAVTSATSESLRKTSVPGAHGLIDIHPPIIGTFYRAPKPGAAPFVEVGSKVGKDTIVGIVETMKLMNSVYAGAAGIVVEICAANGHLVEQDHVLMRLRAP
jgi:acetyl-CoA carboxylase biotin carboxyl carrier protein